MIDRLLEQHARLREHVAALIALMRSPTPCAPEVLAETRWAFVRQLLQHMPLEDRHLYQRLATDPRPGVSETAVRFQAEIDPIYAEFQDHMQRWTPEAITADWADYSAASLTLLTMLGRRIDAEEAELYRFLTDTPTAGGERLHTDRNWAGDAGALRASIGLA